MIIHSSVRDRSTSPPVNTLSGIARVDGMKMLGVYIDNNLFVSTHVLNVCQAASQSLYALRVIKSFGLDEQSVHDVCVATLLSQLTYAIPAWWGFASAVDKQKLQSVLNRATKWGFYKPNSPTIEQVSAKRSTNLFKSILNNPFHVLYQFLPPVKQTKYHLRPRAHNHELPSKSSNILCKNFLFVDCICFNLLLFLL